MALALSVALNAGGLEAALRTGAFDLPEPRATRVSVAPVSAAAWDAHRRVAGELPRAPGAQQIPRASRASVEEPAARAVPDAPRGSVVDVVTSPDRRRPERARFLAERDGTVSRETRSREAGRETWTSPAPRPMAGTDGRHGVAASGEEGDAEERIEGRVGGQPVAPPPTEAATEITSTAPTATVSSIATLKAARALVARAEGDGGRRQAGRWDPRLMPVGARFDAPAGGAPSAGVPRDVADGNETWLNTRRFRYAEFYARVAANIRREWDPNRAWNARDPHDTILGRRTRQARFDLHLEPDGRLREAVLVESSGLGFLDRECLRAVQAAAPFPNPPAALVGSGGAIVLRGWVLSFDFGVRGLADTLRR